MESPSAKLDFLSGLISGFISVTLCAPLEIARTRLNIQVLIKQINLFIKNENKPYFDFH